MPGSWDPKVYRERAQQWREAADKLPAGGTRDAYTSLAECYENLAAMIEKDETLKHPSRPGQSPISG